MTFDPSGILREAAIEWLGIGRLPAALMPMELGPQHCLQRQ